MSKKFDDFKRGFQEIHFQLIAQTINEMNIPTAIPNDQESLNKLISGVGAMNTALTLEILEAYHDWVSRED